MVVGDKRFSVFSYRRCLGCLPRNSLSYLSPHCIFQPTSSFPKSWKITEITSLLKEGDHEVAANNRPLSMLKAINCFT
jgi:hypothetical protein